MSHFHSLHLKNKRRHKQVNVLDVVRWCNCGGWPVLSFQTISKFVLFKYGQNEHFSACSCHYVKSMVPFFHRLSCHRLPWTSIVCIYPVALRFWSTAMLDVQKLELMTISFCFLAKCLQQVKWINLSKSIFPLLIHIPPSVSTWIRQDVFSVEARQSQGKQ